jgi:hypothetical protein
MKNTITLKRRLTKAALLCTTASFTSFFSSFSAFAADNQCLKAYGKTPTEAFRAATKLLQDADAAMGPGLMKDNMQIRLLTNKEKGRFVALAYSTVHYTDGCDLDPATKVTDKPRPKCDKIQCTI